MKINKQKIKKCVIILIFMIIFSLSLIFAYKIQNSYMNFFAEKFSVVTNKNNLLVHFIDVGQGDAIAINLPDDKIFLIDCGTEKTNETYVSYLRENVLHGKRNKYVDYLLLTHADTDHVGGALNLLNKFEVGTVFVPKVSSSSVGYENLINYIVENCNYELLGDEFALGNVEYKLTFLSQSNLLNTNDSSQVVKLEYIDFSMLFVGDISSSVEDELILKYDDFLDCDVLKVSHHGSAESTSKKFLQTVTPDFAVISVGKGNNYGHPDWEVVQRLNNVDANVLRTDEDGNILFAVGEHYNLKLLTGDYYITNLSLNYKVVVLVVDSLLIFCCVLVLLKKEKNKHIKEKSHTFFPIC
jgi:competence protein ComEC